MADRDILFRIGVAAHPETQRRLADLADSVKRTMQSVEGSIAGVGTRAADTSRLVAAARQTQAASQPALSAAAGSRLGAAVADRPLVPPQRPITPEVDTTAARGRLSGLRDEVKGLASEAAGLRGAFDLGSAIADFQSLQDAVGALDDEAAAVAKSLGGIDKELAKASKNGGQTFRELTSNVEGLAGGLGQVAGGLALFATDGSDLAKFVEQLKNIKGGIEVFTGLTKTVSSVVQGYSLLRERSEDAARGQQLLGERTRLASQATDLARQRTELLTTSGRQLVSTLRELASAEETSVRADRKKIESARELANSLEAVISKTTQLDQAEDRLNRNQPRRSPAGGRTAGGIVAPGFRGRGAGGTLLAGLGSLVGYNVVDGLTGGDPLASQLGDFAIDEALGRGLDSSGRRRRGFGRTSTARSAGRAVRDVGGRLADASRSALDRGRNFLGGSGGRFLGGAVAALSAAELAKIAFDSRTGTIDPESSSGQLFGAIGTSRTLANIDRTFQRISPLGRENDATRLADSYDAVDRAQQRADAARAIREREDERKRRLAEEQAAFDPLRDFQSANQRGRLQSLVQSGRIGGLDAARGNSAADARELQRAIEATADAEERISTDRAAYVQSLERAQAISGRLADSQRAEIAAIKEQASLRQAINRDSIAAAERRISLLDTEADRIRGIAKQAEDQLLSGAQRFARLSDSDQRRTIQAQRVAQSGGRLTDEQRGLLDAIGTFGARDAARRADLAEARAKGFDRFFGGEERRLVDASDRSLTLQDRRELGAARSRLGAAITDARRDGRIGLDEAQGIRAARSELSELAASQRFGREARASDRRRDLGFSAQEALRGVDRLDAVGQKAQQLQVTIANRQQFEISLKTNEDAAVRAVQKVLRDNQRGQEERMRKILQAGLDAQREQLRKEVQTQNQQGKNARPS